MGNEGIVDGGRDMQWGIVMEVMGINNDIDAIHDSDNDCHSCWWQWQKILM